jgi:adenosine deaminase
MDGCVRGVHAQVTQDPASHPNLHLFLKQVVGFDMVDDESRPERRPNKHMRTPKEWDNAHNPAYGYYAYYIWANLFVLNKFRESKGYSTFYFRPHAGEAGASLWPCVRQRKLWMNRGGHSLSQGSSVRRR